MTTPASVDDAVRSHVSWLTALAGLQGGATWSDGSLHWAYDGPYGTLHALFPDDPDLDAVERGLARRVGGSQRARPNEATRQPLLDRDDTWCLEARADGRYAGRAWGHVHDGAAGLYDMAHAASPTSRVSSRVSCVVP